MAKVLQDLSAIQARLDALEQENKALKAKAVEGKEASFVLGDFQGHATITCTIPGKRPFYVSVNKVKSLYEYQAKIKPLLK